MSRIICALRGGPDSRATITHAVTLAQEVSLPVHFLYVVNRDLVSDLAVRGAHTVIDQLRQMGNSIVLVAQAIANSHGIPAQGAVRYGYVEDEISELCQDVDADYLILSQPYGQRETNMFTPERLARFKTRVEREAGVEVILVEMVHSWLTPILRAGTISDEPSSRVVTERRMPMQFSIGDKIVHPHRGPGRIVDVEQREFLEDAKQYYVVEIPVYGMTVHVPVRKAADLGMRLAMSRAKVARVLDTLRSRPHRLSKDYKERQEIVWEKIKTGRPLATAEAVRDLTWRSRHANLTKKDSELLKRGQDFLAAEMALALDTDVPEANESIQSALDVAMAAMMEREERQQRLAEAVP